MIAGVLAGFLSAVLQSCAYVASAAFLRRHANPREMLFYSQGLQALAAIPLFFCLVPSDALRAGEIWTANAVWLGMFLVTQLSMFQSQEHVEPSKIATWLGLKIVVLAILTCFWPINGEGVCLWQWLAIGVMLTAVTVLNFSGGMNPGVKGAFWLIVFIGTASLCDRQQVIVINLYRAYGLSLFRSSLLTLSLGYMTFGVASVVYTVWRLRGGRSLETVGVKCRDSAPFAFFWFSAMMSIYFCYGELGPVFGNVVQSTRALIAVGVGLLACRLLKLGVEAPVSRAMWIRRGIAAALMTLGIVLYSLFR